MIKLRTYCELESFYRAFASSESTINLLIVQSRGGLGKTQLSREVIKDGCFIAGHTTPLALYMKAFAYAGRPIILDDIDALFGNPLNIAILKQLCDTTKERTVHYHSSTSRLGDIPDTFQTTSPVLILCNELKTLEGNFDALATRAHVIEFCPENEEIIDQLRTFADDVEVVNTIANAQDAKDINFRHYAKAVELKAAGLPWRAYLLEEITPSDKLSLVRELMNTCDTDRERIDKWQERGYSKRDFYNWKLKIQPEIRKQRVAA